MLENYTLSYYITVLPDIVIYSALTKAKEPLHFKEELNISEEYRNRPIDCFFVLYDSEGEFVKAAHEQTLLFSLKAVINSTPIKLLTDYIKSNQSTEEKSKL